MTDVLQFIVGVPSSPSMLAVLSVLVLLSGLTTYTAIGMSGVGFAGWRIFTALGWTLLTLRLAYAYATGQMPTMPPVASLSVTLICIGAVLRNLRDSSCDNRRGK